MLYRRQLLPMLSSKLRMDYGASRLQLIPLSAIRLKLWLMIFLESIAATKPLRSVDLRDMQR
ncbi:hypothetical protein HY78_15655 [Rhizorhabdus wittichii DC-6]|nr:hypothetical protein HY78_15655 [Rhizorhabdus wittichii DC-6]